MQMIPRSKRNKPKEPKIRIEIDDASKTPRVWIEGKLIDILLEINFDWFTQNDIPFRGGGKYDIAYMQGETATITHAKAESVGNRYDERI